MFVKTFNACNVVHAFYSKIRQEKKQWQTVLRYMLTQLCLTMQLNLFVNFCFNFFSVTQIITTNYRDVGCVSTLGKDCVVTCGEENGQWKLNRYNLRSGKRISCTVLEGTLSMGVQLARVTFNGEECLALSYG